MCLVFPRVARRERDYVGEREKKKADYRAVCVDFWLWDARTLDGGAVDAKSDRTEGEKNN